jgi:hypothetical protein
MIDFPASPSLGQVFTSGASSWTWDGAKWAASGVALSPPLSTGDNRIINGDMRIDQRNNGGSTSTANVYTVDRWWFGGVSAKLNVGRNYISTGGGPPGFPYWLSCQTGVAYTPAVGEAFTFYQPIEADMVSDFAWGTANAQAVTLSFWAYSNQTGTFSGSLSATGASLRSYPFTCFIPVANTWTKIAITVPGDTTGSWLMSGNLIGVRVFFDLGSGANVRGTANTWQAASLVGVTGSVSIVTILNATFSVTGVKLEVGSVATPFNRQSLAKSQADCERYYNLLKLGVQGFTSNGAASSSVRMTVCFTTMRAAPTAAFQNTTYGNASGITTVIAPQLNSLLVGATGASAGQQSFGSDVTLSAEL